MQVLSRLFKWLFKSKEINGQEYFDRIEHRKYIKRGQ